MELGEQRHEDDCRGHCHRKDEPGQAEQATGTERRRDVGKNDRAGDPRERPPEPDHKDERERHRDTDRDHAPEREQKHEPSKLLPDATAVRRSEQGVGDMSAGNPEDTCRGTDYDERNP